VAGTFYCRGNFSLVRGAQTCSGALAYFSKTRDKTPQEYGILEIYVLNIFFAEITFHVRLRSNLKFTMKSEKLY
jgi:hypothetical protein